MEGWPCLVPMHLATSMVRRSKGGVRSPLRNGERCLSHEPTVAQRARRGGPAGMAGRCRSPCRSTDHFGRPRCYRAFWTSSLAATLHGPSSGSDQSCICTSWIRFSVATGASNTITDGHNRLSRMPCRTFRGPRGGDVAHRYGPNPPCTRRTVAPTQIIRPATITASPREPVLHSGIAYRRCSGQARRRPLGVKRSAPRCDR
jgi:hypothetical protein